VSLLAHSVLSVPLALFLPNSAVSSVVELWWSFNFDPLPTKSSGGATGMPVLAVTVISLLRADGSVSPADSVVVDLNWLDKHP